MPVGCPTLRRPQVPPSGAVRSVRSSAGSSGAADVPAARDFAEEGRDLVQHCRRSLSLRAPASRPVSGGDDRAPECVLDHDVGISLDVRRRSVRCGQVVEVRQPAAVFVLAVA